MSRIPQEPDLRREDRPFWASTDGRGGLLYLGWGRRDYGRYPSQIGPRNVWSYSLILRGSPTLLLADGEHRLSALDAVLFSTHGNYRFGFQGQPGGLSEVLIWTWRTAPVVHEARPPLGGYHHCHVSKEACERLKALHAACRREVTNRDRITERLLKALRAEIDAEFARARIGAEPKPSDQVRAQEAVRWLRTHLDRENPVFKLCDLLQVSYPTLGRIFRSVIGESPRQHHQRLLMHEAERLLDEGRHSVKEVAFLVGYKHPNDFSRAFKAFHRKTARKG